jgi:hypothetical protein
MFAVTIAPTNEAPQRMPNTKYPRCVKRNAGSLLRGLFIACPFNVGLKVGWSS